jgi:hypothetical protein
MEQQYHIIYKMGDSIFATGVNIMAESPYMALTEFENTHPDAKFISLYAIDKEFGGLLR